MLLATNINNTETKVGLFRGDSLEAHWRLTTTPSRTPDEWAQALTSYLTQAGRSTQEVRAAILASVVPPVTQTLCEAVERATTVKPLVVDGRSRLPITLDVEEPLSVGADRILNTLAAATLFRRDTIVVDFGTHDVRLHYERRPLHRRGHHAGAPHQRRRPDPQHRQAPRHRAASHGARDRAAHRGLHPLRRAVGRGRGGGRAGTPHQGRVAEREHAEDRRHGRPRAAGRAPLQGDRVAAPRSDARRAAYRGERARPQVVTDARTLNTWRRWGYRLLPGELFSYFLHMRPAEWPIMAGHTALGYVLAVGFGGVARGERLGQAVWGLVIWVVLLNGGTLAINSVFDKDEGDIGYLIAPPRLPRHLLAFCPLFAGLYPLTQLYQCDEDRRRGDRTLALIIGMRRSLDVALGCILLAFALFGWAAVAVRVSGVLLLLPLAAWLWGVVPWRAGYQSWTAARHQRGMYRALAVWAVTDVVVLLVFAR